VPIGGNLPRADTIIAVTANTHPPESRLPRLSLFDTDPAELTVDAVVIGVYCHEDKSGEQELLVGAGAESIVAAFEGFPGTPGTPAGLTATLRLLGATGAAGEVTKLATLGVITAPLVVAVGLGNEPAGAAPAPEALRRAVGAAVRALSGHSRVALALPVPDDDQAAPIVRALAEGTLLGAYQFEGYKSTPAPRTPVRSASLHVPAARDRGCRAALKQAAVAARAARQARDWVNTAPNELRPPEFAERVAAAATGAGLEVEVLDERALRKGGYGGILAVGSGSTAPPRLVRIGYTPARPPRVRIALVGKGITFDTGGLSIKPAQGMWEMTSDMAGAAAVAATMLAVAAIAPDVAVTAWVPMAENMPSGTAYRPGDVVTMYSGKKVEVLNTDAEGRMILADAIARACEEGTDYLLETSTLTGGQVVALGKRVAGVMGTPELCERVREAGEAVGEPAWPMPLPDDVRTMMESPVADLAQVNTERVGTMLQGGIFLSAFVAEGVDWAHIDIAGPSYHTGEPYGYIARGATGVPVRCLLQLIGTL
jgi:leucyl aminopeptidase